MGALRKKPNRFYVYALLDPRDNDIFYIGKGSGERWKRHAKEGLKNSRKWQRICAIKAAGYEYKVMFLATDLGRAKALFYEREYIEQIGLKNLTNLSRGENDPAVRRVLIGLANYRKVKALPPSYWRNKVLLNAIRTIHSNLSELNGDS